jgi:hypothetical protein
MALVTVTVRLDWLSVGATAGVVKDALVAPLTAVPFLLHR